MSERELLYAISYPVFWKYCGNRDQVENCSKNTHKHNILRMTLNHRMVEGQFVQPSCSSRTSQQCLPRTKSRRLLNISMEDSATALGNLCQCSDIHPVKKWLLKFRQHFSLCPRCPLMSLRINLFFLGIYSSFLNMLNFELYFFYNDD